MGLANVAQVARAIAAQRDSLGPTTTTTTTTSTTTNTTPTTNTTTTTTSDDSRFLDYLALLEKQGYFNGVVRDSPAWLERVDKARAKFRSRFADAASPPPPPTTQQPASLTVDAAADARAEQHKAAGNAHLQAKKYDAALAEYAAAIALNPRFAIYHANKAAALSFLNRHDEAIDASEQAIAVDPSYTKAYSRLGLALLAAGRTREALAAYEEAAKREPDNAQYAAAVQSTRAKLQAAEPTVDENDGDDDDDNGDDVAMRGAGGAGGAGFDLASMMNNPMLAGMLQNPQMMAMAQNLMSNPEAMSQMMQNPMVQSMLGGMGRGRPN
jgi:small glutamine-rich tetratricopeptide repeat-containing protein alpha